MYIESCGEMAHSISVLCQFSLESETHISWDIANKICIIVLRSL